MRIIGVDPGPQTSGLVLVELQPGAWPPVLRWADPAAETEAVISAIDTLVRPPPIVVCEWLTSYGSAVGATVLDTARVAGRFEEAARRAGGRFVLMTHGDQALELTGSRRAKDGQLHEAIRQVYREAGAAVGGGAEATRGTKSQPGPLYGLAGCHAWDALGVVLAWLRREVLDRPEQGEHGRATPYAVCV